MPSNRTLLARALVFWLAALVFPQASWAFRCNSHVIDAGMSKMEAMNKCGAPTSRDTRTERRLIRVRDIAYTNTTPQGQTGGTGQMVEREREVLVDIEEWIYNFGPNQFMQLLLFEDGRLISVRDLGYGN
jgi:hypothetical protein